MSCRLGFEYETRWPRYIPTLTMYLYWPVLTAGLFMWTFLVLYVI